MNVDMKLGESGRALFNVRNVRIIFLSTFTNVLLVEFWLVEPANATDFECIRETLFRWLGTLPKDAV